MADVQTNTKLKELKQMVIELAMINKSVCDMWQGNNFNKMNNLSKADDYLQFINKYSK